MSKIRLNDIKDEVEKHSWELLSTSYTNLSTEMQFKCPEGHTVYTTWKKLRDDWECPICKSNKYKNMKTNIVPKKGKQRVLALDQATYVTGYSVYDDDKLINYGTFSTQLDTEIDRDCALRRWLINMIANWQPDLIGLEDIQLQDFSSKGSYTADNVVGLQTFKILAHLQGILMVTIYEANIDFVLCPTPTWRAHCGVKGRSRVDKKKSMQHLIKKWYDVTVTEDEADSIGIGKYLVDTKLRGKVINWE